MGDASDVVTRFDASIEANLLAPSCAVGPTICVGVSVHECVGGEAGEPVIEDCPEVCSFGRCTSPACATAEQTDALRGCRFYAVQADNIDRDDAHNMQLLLTSASAAANVAIELRAATGEWLTYFSTIVPPGGAARVELNRPVLESGLTRAAAFRISSDSPISIAEVMSDDVDHRATSSGGTMLLPVQALGTKYLAISSAQEDRGLVASVAGSRAGAGVVVVVGTVDNTMVHLRPPTDVSAVIVAGSMLTLAAGAAYDFAVNDGDVVQIFSAMPGGDLSGFAIDADEHPIEVFSGNTFTSYGHEMSGFNGADLAIEQLPPIHHWGNEYVGAWLSPQEGCDSLLGDGVGSWQVIASRDDTQVTLYPAPGTHFNLAGTTFRLNRGESLRFQTVPDATPGTPPPRFVASADILHPILLAQWLDCEPGLSFGVDTRFGSRGTDTVFAFPTGFTHELVIVRRAGTAVKLDGVDIGDEVFVQASAKHDFEVARFSEEQLGPCLDLGDGCAHHIAGDAVGVTWRGVDVVCSYALTVPPAASCVFTSCPG